MEMGPADLVHAILDRTTVLLHEIINFVYDMLNWSMGF